MVNLKMYYKVSLDGCYCVLESLEEAQEFILTEMNMSFELGECIDMSSYDVKEVFMTEEEFNNLPEFEGF